MRFTYDIRMSEHGSPTPRNFVHRYAASLKFSTSGPVDQDDLVRFELLLPGFFHDVLFRGSLDAPSGPNTNVEQPNGVGQTQGLTRRIGLPRRLPVIWPPSITNCPLTQTFSIPMEGT